MVDASPVGGQRTAVRCRVDPERESADDGDTRSARARGEALGVRDALLRRVAAADDRDGGTVQQVQPADGEQDGRRVRRRQQGLRVLRVGERQQRVIGRRRQPVLGGIRRRLHFGTRRLREFTRQCLGDGRAAAPRRPAAKIASGRPKTESSFRAVRGPRPGREDEAEPCGALGRLHVRPVTAGSGRSGWRRTRSASVSVGTFTFTDRLSPGFDARSPTSTGIVPRWISAYEMRREHPEHEGEAHRLVGQLHEFAAARRAVRTSRVSPTRHNCSTSPIVRPSLAPRLSVMIWPPPP